MNEAAVWAVLAVGLAAVIGGYLGTALYHWRNFDPTNGDEQ